MNIQLNNNLQEIADLLNRSMPKVTFFGKRVITIPFYKGSESLEKIVRKIVSIVRNRAFDNLTQNEIFAGNRIVIKLRELYVQTDEMIQRSWALKRIACSICDFTLSKFPPRFYVRENGFLENYFCGLPAADTASTMHFLDEAEFLQNKPPLLLLPSEEKVRSQYSGNQITDFTQLDDSSGSGSESFED